MVNPDFAALLSRPPACCHNGIKPFAGGGVKPPTTGKTPQAALSAVVGGWVCPAPGQAAAAGFGRVTDAYSANETYLDHLLATLQDVGGGPCAVARAASGRGLRARRRLQHRTTGAAPGRR